MEFISAVLAERLPEMDIGEVKEIYTKILYYSKQLRSVKGRLRLKLFWELMDAAVKDDLGNFRSNPNYMPITCKKGCSNCCHTHVVIFEEEALHLAKLIRDQKIAYSVPEFEYQTEKGYTSHGDYHFAPRPCVFLKDGACSIYENRPATCRKYFVVEDAMKCRLPGGSRTKAPVAGPFMYEAEIIYSAMIQVSNLNDDEAGLVKRLGEAMRKVSK